MPASREPQHFVDTTVHTVRDAAAEASDAIKRRAGKAQESISAASSKVSDAAGDAIRGARDNVSERAHQAGKAADKLASAAVRTVKEYPIRTVLIVAAAVAVAGFVAGVIASRRS